MALFNKENKEAKQEEKTLKMLQKYGLEDLKDPRDVESVKQIVTELSGTGLMETGMTFGGANEKDILKLQTYYQRALIEQNFIIIRMLDKLTK